jgi:quinol monooxygenase YgiN
MLIVAGELHVDAAGRDRYAEACREVVRAARAAPGCLDFTIAADPLDPTRVNVYERWDTEAALLAFRGEGAPPDGTPEITGADVKRYTISGVGPP